MPYETTYAIRYEGKDADEHFIDLNQLGQSLQGFARILAVCANFCETGKTTKQFESLSVRVLAKPVTEHRCYEISATIQQVVGSRELWSGLGTAVFMALVGYVFNRRKEEEMKHLSAALQLALGNQQATQTQLLATIDKLADSLSTAAKQAVSPVGQSVEQIRINAGNESQSEIKLDRVTKDFLEAKPESYITPAQPFDGIISELDMLTGSCKVALISEPETRLQAIITDPISQQANNPYAKAMSSIENIRFLAKAELDQDGNIIKLYISDLA